MTRRILITITALTVALTAVGVAQGAGRVTSTRARLYSNYAHFTINYRVWDTVGRCTKDEFGFYNNFDCESYDSNDAKLDVRVFRLQPHHAPKRVFSEGSIYGMNGKATEDVYHGFELHEPYCWGGKHWRRDYVAVFRLFDPVTDGAAATTRSYFHTTCS
jgi:hypothetical protein